MYIQVLTNQPIQKNKVFKSNSDKTSADSEDKLLISTALTQAEKPVKKLRTATAATIAAVGTVCVFFMLSKGFQKNANIILNKIKTFFEERAERNSINDSTKQKKFYEFFARRLNSFLKKSESINNITSLKDVLFMKLMYKTSPTKAIHEAISNYFEKISQNTVYKSYEKTEKHFNQMNKIFNELDEYILKSNNMDDVVEFKNEVIKENGEIGFEVQKLTKRELLEIAKHNRDLSIMAVKAFLGTKAIKDRYKYINDATSSLYSSFWEASFKDFWSKDNKFKRKEMWQTFIAAEQIKGDKTYITKCASMARIALTYNDKDYLKNLHSYIKALDSIIPVNDKEGIEIVKKLEWLVKNPEMFKKNKEMFFNELKKLEKHKIPQISDEKVAAAVEECKKANMDLIKWHIEERSPGFLQKMLSCYYTLAPFELEHTGALLSLKKAVKSFDKSFDLEANEFFDKVRDLRLGSAPTDILTIVLSFITLFLGLGHAKDKDARISTTLKSGIPVVGGIATAMYSTARLVSGGKSIILGLLSGIILNQLGIIADNMRKSIKEKQTEKTAA